MDRNGQEKSSVYKASRKEWGENGAERERDEERELFNSRLLVVPPGIGWNAPD